MSARGSWLAARATGLAMMLLAGAAIAEPQAEVPSAAARRDAAQKFVEGTRAFDAGDFHRAGEAFEAAYALAPHPDALWNAARAWHSAGEDARAANHYAHYLRDAPPQARDRASAQSALRALARKLGRIEVHASEGVDDLRVDEGPVTGAVVWVAPGVHVLRGRSARGPVEQQTTVAAGGDVSVLLSPQPSASPPTSTPISTPIPTSAPTLAIAPDALGPSRRSGWSPAVVVVESAVTLAAGGVLVWSSIDTLQTRHTFDQTPTQATLDAGKSEELRTNVIIGVTGGLALLTGMTAIFLVDWRGHREAQPGVALGAGVGSAFLRGSF